MLNLQEMPYIEYLPRKYVDLYAEMGPDIFFSNLLKLFANYNKNDVDKIVDVLKNDKIFMMYMNKYRNNINTKVRKQLPKKLLMEDNMSETIKTDLEKKKIKIDPDPTESKKPLEEIHPEKDPFKRINEAVSFLFKTPWHEKKETIKEAYRHIKTIFDECEENPKAAHYLKGIQECLKGGIKKLEEAWSVYDENKIAKQIEELRKKKAESSKDTGSEVIKESKIVLRANKILLG